MPNHVAHVPAPLLARSRSTTPVSHGPGEELNKARLREAALKFTELVDFSHAAGDLSYHRATSAIHALCVEMLEAENAGLTPDEIREAVLPARELHGESPFVRRLQTWPRGYPGDFETVEYICDAAVKAAPGTAGFFIEQRSLNSLSAQQHRNKIRWQALRLVETIVAMENARILVIASGGARDVRLVASALRDRPCTLVLNDSDGEALAFARQKLSFLGDRLQTIEGDVFRSTRAMRDFAPYDLVLAGGLFDYLTDRHISWLLTKLRAMLAPRGRICFTNIAAGNPDAIWLKYIASWHLTERSEQDIQRILRESPATADMSCDVSFEETGLTHLVELASD